MTDSCPPNLPKPYDPYPRSIPLARRHVAQLAVGWGPATAGDAALLASELCTNALLHGCPWGTAPESPRIPHRRRPVRARLAHRRDARRPLGRRAPHGGQEGVDGTGRHGRPRCVTRSTASEGAAAMPWPHGERRRRWQSSGRRRWPRLGKPPDSRVRSSRTPSTESGLPCDSTTGPTSTPSWGGLSDSGGFEGFLSHWWTRALADSAPAEDAREQAIDFADVAVSLYARPARRRTHILSHGGPAQSKGRPELTPR